jgi:GT2 family glycosyltransferase
MISIITIVKNDRGIEATLGSLLKIQKPEAIEIIVVDASEHVLDDIKRKFPEVRWLYYKNTTNKKITIPEQRNMGIKNAKGEYIVFIDANCIPSEKWLVNLVLTAINDKENIISGSVKINNKKNFNYLAQSENSPKYLPECPTINVMIKTSVFKTVGLFNESFSGGEDVDFMWRAIDKGYKIRSCPEAFVYHDFGNLQDEIKRAYKYGISRAQLYCNHLHRWKNLFKYDVIVLAYPLYILLLPFTYIWNYYPLIIFVPIIMNYKNKPLKMISLRLTHAIGEMIGVVIYFSNGKQYYENNN